MKFILLAAACLQLAAGQYDYAEVLGLSIQFYEIERSGALPPDNRIPWRGDSALGDGSDVGLDLTGGWYDAGDHVKFGFPMAWSTTTVAWGIVAFRDAYESSGELNNALACIKWPLDYFIKAHPTTNEFYGQVADGYADHAFWGRAEDMTMARPSFKIDAGTPGSDLAGETSAAMAAGSIAFRDTDSAYADTLLDHARRLHTFALDYQGLYTAAIPAQDFYGSTGFRDEIAWSAIWLYKATGEEQYLNTALQYYDAGVQWAFSWDAKSAGVQVLMYEMTGEQQYADAVNAFLQSWSTTGGITYTPGGLAWRDQWGPLRYTANSAAIALLAAQLGITQNDPYNWAEGQINYMLGANPMGRSYVCGYGNNPPLRAHHRSSSCNPDHNVPCSWDDYNSPDPNDSILTGALVGGPDANDYYEDDRSDYISNEVANDYNAGFQTALAGLVQLGQSKE